MATTAEVVYKQLSEASDYIGFGVAHIPSGDHEYAHKDHTIELRQVRPSTLALINEFTVKDVKYREAYAVTDNWGSCYKEPVGVIYTEIDDTYNLWDLIKLYVKHA